MYIAGHFAPREKQQILELVQSYPFVTAISKDSAGLLSISHIPVVTETEGDEIKSVKGHFSLRNPQVGHLKADPQVTLIFHGPHTYITPTWYQSGRDVPTWNYGVVHIHGKLELSSSFENICTNLQELTKVFEHGPDAWQFELPSDLASPEQLTSAIIAFTVRPEKIEAKFKLSQNRPMMDRLGVIDGLGLRNDEMSREIQTMMKSTL